MYLELVTNICSIRNLRTIILFSIVGTGILIAVVGVLLGSIRGDSMFRELLSHRQVKLVVLYVSTEGNSEFGSRQLTFKNDTVCNKINSTFKYFVEIVPDRPRLQTKFVKMSVYKNTKVDLFISKTTYSGWVVYIMDKSYKNDSLISVLNEYANIDR
jgi:hypothetical protein